MKRMRLLAVAVATVIAGSACSAPATERQAGGHTHGGGDALRVAGPFEVHSVAPVESSGLFTRLEVVETLVSSDLEGQLQPGLSPDWRHSGATSR